jgi:p-methyltransferase
VGTLDCIIIGYNDVPFSRLADKHKPLQKYSATYNELKTNSVLVGGERKNYMELLNHVIEQSRGVNPHFNAFELPNLGASYLTSFLHQRDFAVELVNFYNYGRQRLIDLLADSPRAVVITTTYYIEDEPIKEIVEFIREQQPDTRIIVGGPYVHNTCAANDVATQNITFRSIGADIYISDSQGEATLAQVLGCLRKGRDAGLAFIPNLIYWKSDGTMGRTHRVEERNSLDENAVRWKAFAPEFYTPTTYMRTARSCPFQCSFCNYPTMSGEHTLASIDTIRQELRVLVEGGLKYIIFVDDTFNVPLPRFKQLCRMMIEENFNLQWISFFRCSNADDECFDLMKQSGCLGVYLGIESGDQEILNNMTKFAGVKKYHEGLRKLHERGIFTFGSFIAGFPGETERSVMNTLEFIEEAKPTFFNVQLYFHDPIAPIEKKREQFGIQGDHYSWRHSTMSWEEGSEWVEYMLRNITSSIPLTLYGFSLWSIPYLLQNGFSTNQIQSFGRTARKMLIKSLDDVECDYREEEVEMDKIFTSWDPECRMSGPDGSVLMNSV